MKSPRKRLNDMIDRHGGVSKVARKVVTPQPSLSRLLNSASMPRHVTMYKIANALGLPETEIASEWSR
ncbi:MAG: helix-turn-helix transcriptional regulator [Deltaproteobacteria bacterium]|nr:helix-turn-helix transcriptional regulator [Deltaproteobacteria bacterium]